MKSRERVEKSLNHLEPDRIPIDFGATPVSGINAGVIHKLRTHYGLKNTPYVKVIEPYQILGEIANDLKEILKVDCIGLLGKKNFFGFENKEWKPWKLFDGTPVMVPRKFNTEICKNGNIYQYPEGDKSIAPSAYMPKNGYYFDAIIRQKPIDENKINFFDNVEEFTLISEDDLNYFEKEADYLYKNTEFAIVGNFGGSSFGDIAFVPGISLKEPKGIRDITEWYISLAKRKDFIKEVFNYQCEIAVKNFQRIYQAISNKISVVFVSGTDFGTQRGIFISKETYRELFKPFHMRINNWIHENTKWKTFMHSCGSIEPLIDDFIEEGFDILNPVQIAADDMDPVQLKEKYGSKITFWGGGVDTQRTLAFGTVQDVKNEVKQLINIFKKNGGFVFTSVHNIQGDVPIENIAAMIETIKEFR